MSAFIRNLFGRAAAIASASYSSANKNEASPATSSESTAVDQVDPIKSAMPATPAGVAEKAAIVVANHDGTMKILRAGSKGITGMPDSPATPGPDPRWMDSSAMKWAGAG